MGELTTGREKNSPKSAGDLYIDTEKKLAGI